MQFTIRKTQSTCDEVMFGDVFVGDLDFTDNLFSLPTATPFGKLLMRAIFEAAKREGWPEKRSTALGITVEV